MISDKIAVSFQKDDAGKEVSMKLYQDGKTFELPRDKPADVELPKK